MRAEFSTHLATIIGSADGYTERQGGHIVASATDLKHIGYIIRFIWNATRGHHLAPWRSPYLRWRIETYTGIKMQSIGFLEFWEFTWRERRELLRFLKWTGEMERYARVRPKNP